MGSRNNEQFKVAEFCRDDPAAREANLKSLADEGYRYVGVANNNGINCTDVIFGK
jgi:hypothetical protein